MAKRQTRRSVSVSGPTYAAISARAAAADVSLSSLVERAIAAELKRCSYVEGAFWCGARAGETGRCGRHVGVVAKAVKAIERAGDRQVERIAEKVRAIPAELRIVAGPPPEQTTMLGRAPTPPADPVRGVDPAPNLRGAALRPLMNAAARAHAVRRGRPAAPPPPIRSGFESAPATAPGRPAPQRVATVPAPAPITRADPLAGVRSGRGGEVSF